ncbi:CD276 antigen isoform X1 [Polypterus senegalus]|uniref:CD276 antigen isoform X1 n=1 Tax=Polypterus senegalus TaxID=55291 RepID=UPI0019667900|nr:CD276 antigen isoform X1 [Polypterus senegalus]XP_039628281.1 CD276 antigen isoform X1 [Polypterus senegalus]
MLCNGSLEMCLFFFVAWVLYASRVAAVLDIKVPEGTLVAQYGKDVVLNCSFSASSAVNISDLSIIWQLADTKKIVHRFVLGQDDLGSQAESFVGRTQLFPGRMSTGDVSLLLRHVQIEDEGFFTCFVSYEDYGSASLQLLVGASYSKPHIMAKPASNLRPGDEVTMSCLSHGGYPEAVVLWLDGRGNNLTTLSSTSQVANEKGLFMVHSVLRVSVEANSSYTCRVKNEALGEETHSSFNITGPQVTFPPVALWVTISLAVCLVVLLIALAYVCRKKIAESCKEGPPAAEEAQEVEEDETKTAMKPLNS